jgi:beta-xylosidase
MAKTTVLSLCTSSFVLFLFLPFAICHSFAQVASKQSPAAWLPDLGNGNYKNPVLYADYSDPDVVRVGDDFWLTSSSFNHVPGLPILRSRDLVNWTIVNHALPRLVPEDHFATVHPGEGVWAPAIRYHAGRFWIYYPDPDFGIYVVTATDPAGEWSKPMLVKAGKGLIDPCPLWDDDGKVYLVHAWARSRSGKNNILTLLRLSNDGTRAVDEGRVIIDGGQFAGMRTLEGPKFYKRNGWYYVFAPTGGVTEGVQSVFRARRIDGPYEHRVVLAQGTSSINGPHQGALVDTASGEWWFLHFQDKGAYGRIVHLEPVTWKDDWPLIGERQNADGVGEPVLTHAKPKVAGALPVTVPQTSDEFDTAEIGLQWQWQANPQPEWATLRGGRLRLKSVTTPSPENLYLAPNLLLQKFPAPAFVATTRVTLSPGEGKQAGLIVFGDDYAWIGQRDSGGSGGEIVAILNKGASKGGAERIVGSAHPKSGSVILRLSVTEGGKCRFAYSEDGKAFIPIGEEFTAKPGRWVGAKVGIFAATVAGSQTSASEALKNGFADFDWFRVTAP